MQTWVDDVFSSTNDFLVDMANIENNLLCLKSMFFGTSAPSDNVAGMPWFDGTNKLPKVRNTANSAWLGIMAADSSHKIWVYRNAAPDGWIVDSSISDALIAIKGGYYNVSGGNTSGSWTQHDHAHTISHSHGGATGSAGSHDHNINQTVSAYGYGIATTGSSNFDYIDWKTDTEAAHAHTISAESGNSGGSNDLQTTWRPYAAAGTLQYMNC